MQPSSFFFFAFVLLIWAIYQICPRKLRCFWLLAASYAFCLSFSPLVLIVILFTTLVSWGASLAIEKQIAHSTQLHIRRISLLAGLLITLAPLILFKYYDFWIGLGDPILSRIFPDALYNTITHLAMPVGISFYTFQLVGYLVDVYRGTQPAEKSLLRYALFASFFPKLIEGPIERSSTLLPQIRAIESLRAFDYDRIASGLYEIVWGLFLKMVLADRIAPFINPFFENVASRGSTQLIIASLGYTFQLYLDFSGYMFIILGVARCFGFTLLENFNAPYLATSTSDFWRRWHMSLSSWLRDYVYIPLGGSRVSRGRHLFNVMAVMFVSGLWHGASWNFVAWGLLHGFYQVAGILTRPFRQWLYQKEWIRAGTFSFHLAQRLSTFCLISLAWIFFRANTLQDALTIVIRIFTRWDPWNLLNGSITTGWSNEETVVFCFGMLLVFCTDLLREKHQISFPAWLQQQNVIFRWFVIITLFVLVLVFGMYGTTFDSSQFLYFQF